MRRDWDTKPIEPAVWLPRAKVAFKPSSGRATPQAVRPEQAHAVLAGNPHRVDFKLGTQRAAFTKAGRQHGGDTYASLAALVDQAGHGAGWGGDDGQIHLAGHFADAAAAGHALY